MTDIAARGTQAQFILYDEDSYGEPPETPSGKRVYLATCGLSSSQEKLEDDTLNVDGGRTRARPDAGNIDAQGALVVRQNAHSMPYLLKHALGQVASWRPVSEQPSNVTGVEVLHAHASCPTGDGTLSYTASGTLLAWAASGDSAGTGVNVSAGGTFTLQSGSASHSLVVVVDEGELPVGDQSDNDITVVSAYKHIFTLGDLPAGFTFDKDYGQNITGAGRVENFTGDRIADASFEFPQTGYLNATFNVRAANSSLASAVLDDTPTDPGHRAFTGASIRVMEEGGASIATLRAMTIALNNELDEETGYTINPDAPATRTSLTEGFATVTGQITAVFSSPALLNKAIASTESSLRYVAQRGDGFGTAGNERLEYLVSQLEYERASPEIAGPGGLIQSLNFKAFGADSLIVTVYNNVANP